MIIQMFFIAILVILLCEMGVRAASDGQPYISDMSPTFGPVAGGTRVTITIQNSTEHPSEVLIGKWPCAIDKKSIKVNVADPMNAVSVTCTTMKVEKQQNDLTVQVKYSSSLRSPLTFTYMKNPEVTEVIPLRGPGEEKFIGSIQDGGMDLTIIGQNLNSVEYITVRLTLRSSLSLVSQFRCTIHTPELANCTTPRVNVNMDGIRYLPTKMELFLDGVQYRDTQHLMVPNGTFYIAENPEFYEKVYEWKASGIHNVMHISGDKIDYVANEEDYKVTIGDRACTVTGMTTNMLIIIPPDQTELNSSDHKFLKIVIGDFSTLLGEVKYGLDSEDSSTAMLPVIIVCCLLIFTLALGGVYFLNRRRKQNLKKKIMMSADNLGGPIENFYSVNAPGHDAQGYLQPIQHQTSRVSVVSSESSGTLRRASVIASLLHRQSVNSISASLPNSPKTGT